MVTNKSSSIRLGLGRNWPVKSVDLGWSASLTNVKIINFVETLFSDEFFRSRGITLSNCLVKKTSAAIYLKIIIQDSKISDFYNTFPYRSLFGRKLVRRRHRRFPSIYSTKRRGKKYYLLKKALFIKPRNFYGFTSGSRTFLRLYKKKFLPSFRASHRHKLRRRRYRFRVTRFYSQLHFARYHFRSIRSRFYVFLSRFFSSVLRRFSDYPIRVNFSFFSSRHATASFYLNYITTKLYYRYILSDVVSPIVRLSLRNYRGFAINCKGRFTRAQIAVQKYYRRGRLGFSTLSVPIDYAQKSVVLKYGTCNLKIWIRH